MHYKIEVRVQQSTEHWFVDTQSEKLGLTRRDRNATEFNTLAEAKLIVEQLLAYSPKQMRKLLGKEMSFETPVSFTVLSWKNTDTAPFQSMRKLFIFKHQE